ncbi:MAG: myo-inositol 2-dehydrogenase / D-chiro-inositol 1-dehydrogenase [Chthoniobacter sp.]|jgi:predicted dehydrogenase|nr:myo-inositol 2-dehydrogenase / D-chiro-inositol 1-dehydrogenase [Chthoniobacter sp.]
MNTPVPPPQTPSALTRRSFITTGTLAGGALLASLPISRFAHGAAGGGPLKLAMVGGGGRGSGAANQALKSGANVQLVAIAELFLDRAQLAIKNLAAQNPGKVEVPEDHIFLGFEAYKQAIAGCDVIILATPCTFRPMMFEEAVRQGKHVFMEKPVALDSPGIRRVLAAAAEAKKKNLKVGVGLQRRHKPGYLETVKRVQDGALGQLTYFRTYWNMGAARAFLPRKPEWNELEFQLRNQFYFAWQCGDIHLDMGLHNLDVINWIKGAYPVRAIGQGGAEVRRGKDAGAIYDHMAIQYEYADGTRLFAENRQIPGCWTNVTENAHGTKGAVEMINDRNIFIITGEQPWRYEVETPTIDPYQREHDDLFAAIVNDQPYNEAERGAMSTMSGIMGRMAVYSGQKMEWEDALKSERRFAPDISSLQDPAPIQPDENGAYPLPIPGKAEPV